MEQDKTSGSPRRPRPPSKDIRPILEGWEYESGTINVRRVTGVDGLPKIQMRLDLGLLQMEMSGRPDGARPHGAESLLDYHEQLLREHRLRFGTEEGFHLTPDQCSALRDEALMYYHRYLSLFVLGEFSGVVRDTARNLRVLNLCNRFADEEHDRLVLEQYRPYILMMNARGRASIQLKSGNLRRALSIVRDAIRGIKTFFEGFGQPQAFRHSNEVRILKQFARDIRARLPRDPRRELQRQLKAAVAAERYEEAARLRDEIMRLGPDEPRA